MAGRGRSSSTAWERTSRSSKFAAAGFDAAIIVGAPPTEAAGNPGARLLAQAGVRARGAGAAAGCAGAARAARRGAAACSGSTAARSRPRAAGPCHQRTHRASTSSRCTALRSRPDFDQIATNSARVTIRGHRCIRQVGIGGMCKIYLAESERAGAWWCSRCSARCRTCPSGSSASTASCRNTRSSRA